VRESVCACVCMCVLGGGHKGWHVLCVGESVRACVREVDTRVGMDCAHAVCVCVCVRV